MKYTQILQLATKILFIGLFTSVYTVSFAQDWDRLSVDFREDGKLLFNSGINGMVAPQFSNIDFNGDGDTDLFVFDRQSGVVMTFVWEDSEDGGRLVYDPQYAVNFPELVQFARLVDYDRDGDMDIFTYPRLEPASGIQLFRNEGTDQNPDYVAVKFPDSPANVLSFILSNGQLTTIFTASTDVPAIVDINGDGDLDVLSFEQNAGSLVNYFENQQVENGLPKDSMIFRLQDLCWGKFFEAGDNSNIFLSDDPNSCSNGGLVGHGSGGGERHAGSTIEVFDVNGDGLVDATIGDLSNDRIVYLQNGGSLGADWMNSQIPNFPAGENPVSINIFLSSFFVDVTNDGLVDFIAAPNEKNSSWNAGHVWMYENVGRIQ